MYFAAQVGCSLHSAGRPSRTRRDVNNTRRANTCFSGCCAREAVRAAQCCVKHAIQAPQDSLAEWSKALASGASPQGRGFEPHSCHFVNPLPGQHRPRKTNGENARDPNFYPNCRPNPTQPHTQDYNSQRGMSPRWIFSTLTVMLEARCGDSTA